MIVNLTQHLATQDQIDAGVIDLPTEDRERVMKHLTFSTVPTKDDMLARANGLTLTAKFYQAKEVMIGGAPFFMPILERVLKEDGIQPLYAFSARVVEEEHLADGSVKKVAKFKHKGFYAA